MSTSNQPDYLRMRLEGVHERRAQIASTLQVLHYKTTKGIVQAQYCLATHLTAAFCDEDIVLQPHPSKCHKGLNGLLHQVGSLDRVLEENVHASSQRITQIRSLLENGGAEY